MGSKREQSYADAIKADDNWHRALVAAYGAGQAGNARYDERGAATPELAALKKAKRNADKAWVDETNRGRAGQGGEDEEG